MGIGGVLATARSENVPFCSLSENTPNFATVKKKQACPVQKGRFTLLKEAPVRAYA